MNSEMRVLNIMAALIVIPFLVLSCSKDNSTAPVDDARTPPSFNISSIQTTLVGGDPGIRFRASSNVRVRLVEIVVTNPNNASISYSPQGLIVQANQAFDLQEDGTAFFRWSGGWRFKFVGNHEPTGESFDVTQNMSVSAKELPFIIEGQ